VPVHFWASGKALGVQESTEANVTAMLSAKPALAPDWTLKVNPETSFRWDSHPELKIFGIFSIGIQDALTDPMNEQMKKQVSSIAAQLEGTGMRERATALWAASFKPIQLSKEHNVWLRMGMEQASFSGLNISNNILSATVGVQARTEVFKDIEPAPLPATPMPALGSGNLKDTGFNIALPVTISYAAMNEALSKVLKKGQKWAPIPSQPKVLVTVKDVDVYPSHGALAIRIDFIADLPHQLFDTSGTVYLSGRPSVDDAKKVFSVQQLSFTAETSNHMTNLIGTVMRPAIENRIAEALTINYQPQIDALLAESNVRLNRDFGNGVTSSGKLSSAKLKGLYLTDKAAVIQIGATGKLELSYGL
jgi:hypothetical protein